MFTGIIEAVGSVEYIEPKGGDVRMTINSANLDMNDVALGDSIAANGVCLTVIERTASGYVVDISGETLSLTTLGNLAVGSPVNLEKAMRSGDRFGGHMVSGHVDGMGEVVSRHGDARSVRFSIRVPSALAKYIAHKGSVTVDGTSLTVNSVAGCEFELNIIPHTLEHTIFGGYQPGTAVNIEVDIIARYLERLLMGDKAAES